MQATVDNQGRATIAYVLGSAYWGRGLACEAVQAMTRELARRHGVRQLAAVFKQRNLRSRRLLERLGFQLATPAARAEQQVEPDELLMTRELALP